MLVPFSCNASAMVGTVCKHIIKQLEEKFQLTTQGGAREQDAWEALQCELALEKVFWGALRSTGMRRGAYGQLKAFSVNLGPGHNVPSRCRTDELGFLALTHHTEAVTDTSPLPPFGTWTTSDVQVVCMSANVQTSQYTAV